MLSKRNFKKKRSLNKFKKNRSNRSKKQRGGGDWNNPYYGTGACRGACVFIEPLHKRRFLCDDYASTSKTDGDIIFDKIIVDSWDAWAELENKKTLTQLFPKKKETSVKIILTIFGYPIKEKIPLASNSDSHKKKIIEEWKKLFKRSEDGLLSQLSKKKLEDNMDKHQQYSKLHEKKNIKKMDANNKIEELRKVKIFLNSLTKKSIEKHMPINSWFDSVKLGEATLQNRRCKSTDAATGKVVGRRP